MRAAAARLVWLLATLAAAAGSAAAPPAWLVFDGLQLCRVAIAPAPAPDCTPIAAGMHLPPVAQGDARHWWLGSGDKTLLQFDAADGRLQRRRVLADKPEAIAASRDGQHVLTAFGDRLSVFDAQGAQIAGWPLRDRAGHAARVLGLVNLPARLSFLVLLAEVDEAWEIAYDPAAPPVFDGMVHDYRMGEGMARPGYLALRRILLPAPLRSAFADGSAPWFWAQPAEPGGMTLQLVHLDVRRVIASWGLALASAPVRLQRDDSGVWVLATQRALHFVETGRWSASAAWPLDHTLIGLQADAAGRTLWVLQRRADGTPALQVHPGGMSTASAVWRDAGIAVTAWAPSPDGTQLLLAWHRADDAQRGGLLWLDGRTLAPLQRSEGAPWRGVLSAPLP